MRTAVVLHSLGGMMRPCCPSSLVIPLVLLSRIPPLTTTTTTTPSQHRLGRALPSVLLFCQTRQLLNMLESFIKYELYQYLRLDGTVRYVMKLTEEAQRERSIICCLTRAAVALVPATSVLFSTSRPLGLIAHSHRLQPSPLTA